MTAVGVKRLKNQLSEYIRRAAGGETIVITDRDRVVAELGPPRPKPESFMQRGIREGWLRPAIRGPNWPPPPTPIAGYTLERLLEELEADREDRC